MDGVTNVFLSSLALSPDIRTSAVDDVPMLLPSLQATDTIPMLVLGIN